MEERRRGTGEVLVGFWVTAEGLADTASVVFRRISDPAFAPSVLAALKEWRFKPALASSVDSSDAGYFAEWERCTAGKQGVPVAALVQMPLLFEPPH
jgi:TonB family protein